MVLQVLTYEINKSNVNDVMYWIRECEEASKSERGLKLYKVYAVKNVFTHLIYFERDDQFQDHMNSAHVKLFIQRLEGACRVPPEFITAEDIV